MKRLSLLLLLALSGCSQHPTVPVLPTQEVKTGPLDGEPAAPRVHRFTARIEGDELHLTAALVPTAGPLPSYAEWGFQVWVGTRWLDPGQVTSAEYVVTARELQDIGPLDRVIRRTEGPSFPCEGPGGWCDSVGTASIKVLNGRRLEMTIPLQSIGYPRGTVACWLLFGAAGRFSSLNHCLAQRQNHIVTERL